MKHLILCALLFPLQLLAAPDVRTVPQFVEAKNFSLDNYRGQVVYLDFWASWCVPCRLSFPWLNQSQTAFGGEGLQIIAVNVDTEREDAEDFLSEQPSNFPIVLDPKGQLAEHYQLVGMPSAVLIGRDGHMIKQHTGFREKDKPELEAAIRAALEGKQE